MLSYPQALRFTGKEASLAASLPSSTLEKFTTFGDLLRYLRRASGLTQLELSIHMEQFPEVP